VVVGVFRNDRFGNTREAFDGVVAGLELLGVDHFVTDQSKYVDCDVAVVWGIFKKKGKKRRVGLKEIFDNQQDLQKDVLVMERGFIRRDIYSSIGWNGLNGRADFKNKNMPSDRFEDLNIDISPWRNHGESILLCGQVPWDSSVQTLNPWKGYDGYSDWCRDTIEEIKKNTDRPIVFRNHPDLLHAKDAKRDILNWIQQVDGVTWSEGPIEEDFEKAWAVVAFNSNVTVDAALRGIPIFVDDIGAMAMDVANTDLSKLNNPDKPDRSRWLNDISYSQWTPSEMSLGLPIKHLLGLGEDSD